MSDVRVIERWKKGKGMRKGDGMPRGGL